MLSGLRIVSVPYSPCQPVYRPVGSYRDERTIMTYPTTKFLEIDLHISRQKGLAPRS
jgi:hypothetical protein